MFGLFSPSRKTKKGPITRQARLGVEELESRWCPAGITLVAEVLAGHQVQLSGMVDEPNPETFSVNFSGAVTGNTTPDSTGYFSFITEEAELGAVYAVGVDEYNQPTDPASATIAVDAPVIILSILDITPTSVTMFGHVSSIDADDLTVTISGLGDDTVSPDSDGNFFVSYSISESGSLYATTTDLWGQTAATVQAFVMVPEHITPQITLTATVLCGHQVQLTGFVTADNPAAVVVTFSGAVTGSTTTDADGNFIYTTASATLGTVYADGVDQANESTDTATDEIEVEAPTLTMVISSLTHDTVLLTGRVTGIDAAGQTVTISGAASGSAVTDANGNYLVTLTTTGTGTIQAVAIDRWGQASELAEDTITSLPSVNGLQLSLNAQTLAEHEIQLTGTLIGANVAGALVEFSGSVSGSTTTDAYGNYSYTTSSGSLGGIYAVAHDVNMNTSNIASMTLAVATPALSFAISSTSGSNVTFSGKLHGVDAAFQSITIGGAVSRTVTTDAAGDFSFTEDRSTVGVVTASATDLWGQTFCAAEVDMPEHPPVIREFGASNVFGQRYLFRGRVLGDNMVGRTVAFGGLTELTGQTAVVGANGLFFFSCDLAAGGTASAQVTDLYSRVSNLALYYVS